VAQEEEVQGVGCRRIRLRLVVNEAAGGVGMQR